jgi:hypothetical protein
VNHLTKEIARVREELNDLRDDGVYKPGERQRRAELQSKMATLVWKLREHRQRELL